MSQSIVSNVVYNTEDLQEAQAYTVMLMKMHPSTYNRLIVMAKRLQLTTPVADELLYNEAITQELMIFALDALDALISMSDTQNCSVTLRKLNGEEVIIPCPKN